MREDQERAGHVSCEEAKQILRRFNASHFRGTRHAAEGECARYSIPADPLRDDDIRMSRFIDQAEEWQACLASIAYGDGGDTGAHDWPEFWESVKRRARDALKGGG